ncbi:MAG: decarboxylating NADP(+)-dependent phosphogluconate dehydrogenase [Spartobacteria bacterium]|nr:decarboxylating NADP(+)-dependent phosphogluconate dehydrogenase [Spartobacteria bacterium]
MSDMADIGIIGLAVMGENLILNMANHGYTVACFNRTTSKVDAFINGRADGKSIIGCYSLEELVRALELPRKVMLMVKAGGAVDALIEALIPLLAPGDIIIDGGNSYFKDTTRRVRQVEEAGLRYIGTGISGGEEGALKGPSIMPGGSVNAWEDIRELFQTIAAKTETGAPCCDWVGEQGAGHFVKMVHNGIEYGDMQLIGEVYHFMRVLLGLTNEHMHEIFTQWNRGVLNSYLIEITADILAYRNEQGEYALDAILDATGQKGTGKWTVMSALESGQPLTLISEAVFARCLSSLVDERRVAAEALASASDIPDLDTATMTGHLEQALYASKIVSYAQGYQLMRATAQEQGWHLDYGAIARMWSGGCIIRSAFLGKIREAYDEDPELVNLLLAPFFKAAVLKAERAWRICVACAVESGLPMPAVSSALAYFDGYRCARLPANLLQAQRDYFGAHTYERLDTPRGTFFHTNWTGEGGDTASTSYDV